MPVSFRPCLSMGEPLGDHLDVGVVVNQRQPVLGRDGGGEQVADADPAVPTRSGQTVLGPERSVPVVVVDK